MCPFDPLCAPDILSQLKYLYISERAESSYIKVISFSFQFIFSNISIHRYHVMINQYKKKYTFTYVKKLFAYIYICENVLKNNVVYTYLNNMYSWFEPRA